MSEQFIKIIFKDQKNELGICTVLNDAESKEKTLKMLKIKEVWNDGKDASSLIESQSKKYPEYFPVYFSYDAKEGLILNIEKIKEKKYWEIIQKFQTIFSHLDVEFFKVLETSNKAKKIEIINEKNVMRNFTIEKIPNTLSEIENFTLPILEKYKHLN